MPSLELSKLQAIGPARSVSESDRAQTGARVRSSAEGTSGKPAREGVALEVNASLDVSNAPVDTDRVDEIRRALKEGTYPLVPAKIADAIIAARIGFGVDSQ